MKTITRKTLAATAAERWKEQYSNSLDWEVFRHSQPRRDTYNELLALGPNPSPNDIDETIGNDSWTSVPRCSECSSRPDCVVEIGEEPDYESSTAWMCRKCLRAAIEELGTVPIPDSEC